MEKITAKEFTRSFGVFRTKAHQSGVIITHHGHDDLALISADEFKRLKELDQKPFYIEELPNEVIEGFGSEPLHADASKYNGEYSS